MDVPNGVDGLRASFEAGLSDLRGRQVMSVEYWDLPTFTDEPAQWDYGDWHHAVMGAVLITDRGPVTVTWTATFFPYGVEVFHGPIEDHFVVAEGGPQRIGPDLGSSSPWHRYLSTPIRRTAAHWERLKIGPGTRADGSTAGPAYHVDLPTALCIEFPAGAVWFVAAVAQPPDMQSVFIPGDEIMVVFSAEKMRDMGFDDPTFRR